MLKEYCAVCKTKESCYNEGECLDLFMRRKLGIEENVKLSEVSNFTGLEPGAETPIVYLNPFEKNDSSEADWI